MLCTSLLAAIQKTIPLGRILPTPQQGFMMQEQIPGRTNMRPEPKVEHTSAHILLAHYATTVLAVRQLSSGRELAVMRRAL
jgi:hypothetical protein